MGAQASGPGEYEGPGDLPEGLHEVRVSVYKLEITGYKLLDRIATGLARAYHSGLVVDAWEWSFGAHPLRNKTGVYKLKPEMNADYLFYDRIVMGRVRASSEELLQRIHEVGSADTWMGPEYDLMEHNCNHFTSDLCWALLRRRPPAWINATANSVAAALRKQRVKEEVLAGIQETYALKYRPEERLGSIPGYEQLENAFTSVFDEVMGKYHAPEEDSRYGPASEEVLDLLPSALIEHDDPMLISMNAEREKLAEAAFAAVAAGLVYAACERAASGGRRVAVADAAVDAAALEAWDSEWRQGSSSLLFEWRAAAIAGHLPLAEEDYDVANVLVKRPQVEPVLPESPELMPEARARKIQDVLARAAAAALAVTKEPNEREPAM